MIKYFNIPKRCEVSKVIPKSQFYDNGDLTSAEKEFFSNAIKRIRWEYSLKTENINIASYDSDEYLYPEVEFFTVELIEKRHLKKVLKLIEETIPYPIVSIVEAQGEIFLTTTKKKIHKEKIVLEEIYMTTENANREDFLNTLDIKTLNSENFLKFQNSIIEKIISYNISTVSGVEIATENIDEKSKILLEIEELDNKIESLKLKRKKESQINRVAEIQVELLKLVEIRKEKIKLLK